MTDARTLKQRLTEIETAVTSPARWINSKDVLWLVSRLRRAEELLGSVATVTFAPSLRNDVAEFLAEDEAANTTLLSERRRQAGFDAAKEQAMQLLEAHRRRHGTGCDCKSFDTIGTMLDQIAAMQPAPREWGE